MRNRNRVLAWVLTAFLLLPSFPFLPAFAEEAPIPAPSADLNGDERVDLLDLILLADRFRAGDEDDCPDLDGDGIIGVGDLYYIIRLLAGTNDAAERELLKLLALHDGEMPDFGVEEETGNVNFLGGSFSDEPVTDGESAVHALGKVENLLGLTGQEDFVSSRTNETANGTKYVLSQTHDGVAVYGGEIVVSAGKTGETLSLNSAFIPVKRYDGTEILSMEEAFSLLCSEYPDELDPEGEKVYFPREDGSAVLAYRFDGLYTVVVSASDGRVLDAVGNRTASEFSVTMDLERNGKTTALNLIKNDRDTVDPSDDYYSLHDEVRNVHAYDLETSYSGSLKSSVSKSKDVKFFSSDFADPTERQNDVLTAFVNASRVMDFYRDTLGLDSFDDNGGGVYLFVNDGRDDGCNAYSCFDSSGSTVLAFGNIMEFEKKPDVVCHEFTHSVQRALIPDFNRTNEMATLAEAYADVMGELFEWSENGRADWRHGLTRNLADPEKGYEVRVEYSSGRPSGYHRVATSYPTVCQGEYWDASGECHTNSTVISHAIWQMTQNGFDDVSELSELLYETWSGLTSTADFTEYRNVMLHEAMTMGLGIGKLNVILSAFSDAGINDGMKKLRVKVFDAETDLLLPGASVFFAVLMPGFAGPVSRARVASTDAHGDASDTLFSWFDGSDGVFTAFIEKDGYEKVTLSFDVGKGQNEIDLGTVSMKKQEEIGTEGLVFTLLADDTYSVSGYGGTDPDVVIPSSHQGKPVTEIGQRAFYDCDGITSVRIADSVKNIGESAFRHCDLLKRVTFGSGVETIGREAFFRCLALTSLTIPGNVKTIGKNAFEKCAGLTKLTLGNGIGEIGDYAFYQCTGLRSVTIPDSVTFLGASAFRGCDGLEQVTLGKGLKEIASSTFYACIHLQSVSIPDGVTQIGSSAFYSCSAMTDLSIGSGVTYLGDNSFKNCTKLANVTFRGTVSQWNAITKERYWKTSAPFRTVSCSDGEAY